MRSNVIRLDDISKFFVISIILLTLLFQNGLYLFLCLAVLSGLFFFVQPPFRTGVFTFILIEHILQIIVSVFQANYLNQDINFRSPENSTAIVLSLIGVVVLFLPIIYQNNKLPKVTIHDLTKSAQKLSTEKSMYFYIVAFFVTAFLTGIAFIYSGLTQIIFSLIKIKWFFFLLFGFQSLLKNEKRKQFYLLISLEIVLGFFSFFSEFKIVLYFLIILLLSFIGSINIKQVFIGLIVGSLLLFLAIMWTSIKSDYRRFLNKGSESQSVEVSRDEALNKLYDLSTDVDESNIESSTKDFLDRLQYTFHFAKTLQRVPDIIPFQNGDNLLKVITYTTTPRFLNPDKEKLDNSVKASYYTGIKYAGAKKGVSFSLGYFAECYVDFGKLGMMFPILLIGLIYGKLYQYFMTKSSTNLIFNYAVVGSFFMEFYAYEMDGTYLIGRLFASILTYILLVQVGFPALFQALTETKKSTKNRPILMKIFR